MYFFSYSIIIAGVLSIIKFKKINKAFRPFIFCLWIGCINDALSAVLIPHHYQTSLNNNIYVLIEAVLLILLFKNFEVFSRSKYLLHTILISLLLVWIMENFIFSEIFKPDIYFRIFYSLTIVFMSINCINDLIINNRKSKAVLVLCIAFIFYFTYKVFVFTFWISGLSNSFLSALVSIMMYVNLLTNLIYALAVLWMPKKLEFSLRY